MTAKLQVLPHQELGMTIVRTAAQLQAALDRGDSPITVPTGVVITGNFTINNPATQVISGGGTVQSTNGNPVFTITVNYWKQGGQLNFTGATLNNSGGGAIVFGQHDPADPDPITGFPDVTFTRCVITQTGASPQEAFSPDGNFFFDRTSGDIAGPIGVVRFYFRDSDFSSSEGLPIADDAIITGSSIAVASIQPATPGARFAQCSNNQITTTGLCVVQSKTPIFGNTITAQYVAFTAPSAIGNKVTVTALNTPNNIFNVDQVTNLKLKGPGGAGNVPRSTFNKDDASTTMLQLDNLNLDGDMWVMMDAQQNNVVASHNLTEAGAVSTFKGQITNVKTVQVSSTTNSVGAVNVSGNVFPPVTQFTP